MSDLTPQAIISHMKDDARNGPLAKPLMIARIIAITAAVAGAVPTAVNFYHSWAHGIPYNEVSHRLSQYDLWVKNFECKIDYRALTTQAGTRVDVGSCPKSGDIAIKVSAANGKSSYEWIAFDQLQKSQASLMDLLVAPALAEEAPKLPAGFSATTPLPQSKAPTLLAQAAGGMQVLCEKFKSPTEVVRIVNEAGKCYREFFSPYRGKVEKREEVPCNTQCPGAPAKG